MAHSQKTPDKLSKNQPNQLDTQKRVHLKDYAPFPFEIEKTVLDFTLDPHATSVRSLIYFKPSAHMPSTDTITLDGQGLVFKWAKIDGKEIAPYITSDKLTAKCPTRPFLWEAEVEINPTKNTALQGLYMSNEIYCTQCEAEGFRRITYYPDRPDVMAPFDVTIKGNASVLLSNGNNKACAQGWAKWCDPWPKPSYLFALVAGDLRNKQSFFTTQSGKKITLNIWVKKKDLNKTAFAMQSLKNAMAWDEKIYGREYDLDVFNIVAVDDFTMGAMENKGLNIFNASAILANPATATDDNFENIETIIAHEYFHNWTGNRITCRDWFQLCLKEGLTVYRDQQFSADRRVACVERIKNVETLRTHQFPEDNGPLAHPVRPESFIEINNFYTATIYEKGAELIHMLHQIVGQKIYEKALALYFKRFDGMACTIENWLDIFEETSGRNLTQFKHWYSMAGTPELKMDESWDGSTFLLNFEQSCPSKSDYKARTIFIKYTLFDQKGQEILSENALEMTSLRARLRFDNLENRPVISLLRGFSSPIILNYTRPDEDYYTLFKHDSDYFNRWESGCQLFKDHIFAHLQDDGRDISHFAQALKQNLQDENASPAFRALILKPPNEKILAQEIYKKYGRKMVKPAKIYTALKKVIKELSHILYTDFVNLYQSFPHPKADDISPTARGQRTLRHKYLAYICEKEGTKRAQLFFENAGNMTEEIAALSILINTDNEISGKTTQDALKIFYEKWQNERLVVDKWFTLQVGLSAPDIAADKARTLCTHPKFTFKNPNRVYAVFKGLFQNHAGFHHESGQGYMILANALITLDRLNPQMSARLSTAFNSWPIYAQKNQNHIFKALEHVAHHPQLSKDLGEMIARMHP